MILCIVVFSSTTSAQQQMWVTGYWPVWAYPMTPETANWNGLTHVIHFSANPVQTPPYLDVLVSATDSLKMENNGSDVGQVNRLISNAHAHGVKVLLSLGGVYGTGATNMNYICSDSVRTDVFATASAAYARRRGYDGIEVDWEPPSSAAASARLYRLIRRELNTWPVRGQLAVAVANNDSFSPFTKFYDTQELINDVDQCNVMMYDMHLTPSYSGSAYDVTGYNAPLNPPGSAYPILDQYSWNYDPGKGHTASAGVRLWNAEGMPFNKMAAGIPFYAYFYKGKTAPNQPRSGVWPQYISYANVMLALQQGGTYHWDNNARVPWISGTLTAPLSGYATTGDQFYITFDDTASIAEKVKWAKQLGLGGIMIYELYMGWVNNATVKDPLLRAVANALNAGTVPVDTTKPTSKLTSPLQGDSITAGTSVTLAATASDNIGVVRVDFLVNGSTIGSSTAAPYTCTWNTTGLSGAQTVAAKAWDAAGNNTTSGSVVVYMKPVVVATTPAVPTLASPATGATGLSQTPTLAWNASTGAVSYRLQVASNSAFTVPLAYDDSTLAVTTKQLPSLSAGTTYYWRVCAKNSAGTSAWSAAWSFATLVSVPPAGAGDNWMYQDGIISPWLNYSWSATSTLNSTEHVYAGTTSWKTVTTAWGAISFHNGIWGTPGVTPSAYSRLEFAVYNTTPGLTLNVTVANDQGFTFPATNLQPNLPVNQWIVVSVPVSTLDPAGVAFCQVSIQNYTGGTATWYVDNVRLVGNSGTPPVPVLLTPASNATGQPVAATLTWSASAGAASYQVEVGADSLFTNLVLNDTTVTATTTVTPLLNTGSRYFWRVNAKGSAGRSSYSRPWSFSTVASAPGDIWICRDALEIPWINSSWSSTVTFNSTEHVYAGTGSLKCVANPWGGVSFHNGAWGQPGVNPAVVDTLQFAVYTTTSNLTLNVQLANDQSGACTSLNMLPVLPVNRWTVISLPMAQLNPNKYAISQVSIGNATGLGATYYVDNVRMIGINVAATNPPVITAEQGAVARQYSLGENYPNPFNPSTTVRFEISDSRFVRIRVYDELGREVAVLVNEVMSAGAYTVVWNAEGMPGGVYYCRMEAGGYTAVRKMMLVR